jgi:hypothetical protein
MECFFFYKDLGNKIGCLLELFFDYSLVPHKIVSSSS